MFAQIVVVAVGAAVGGVLRFIVANAFVQRFGAGFPYGTLFINVTGSFCIGLIAQLAVTRTFGVSPLLKVFAMVGVLGGYTTFSSFALESVTLTAEGAPALAAAYMAASVSLGFCAAYAGGLLGRLAG
jgi:CrcB protein